MYGRQAAPINEAATDTAIAEIRKNGCYPRFVEGEKLGVGHFA
jgi:hypothetical protein